MTPFLLLAAAVAAAGDEIALQNGRLALRLDRGRIVSLRDKATGQEFINGSAPRELFALRLSEPGPKPGKRVWLSSAAARAFRARVERRAGTTAAVLEFSDLGGRGVDVACSASVREGDPFVRWTLRVRARSRWVLEEAQFPAAALRAPLAGDGARDALVAGLTKGGVFRRPAAWPVGRALSARQPGALCAQFGCYYAPRAGFYAAAQDARGFPKGLLVRRARTGLEWAWRRWDYHDLSRPFELGYAVVMTTFSASAPGADWRDAADIYKAWATKQPWCARTLAQRGDLPDWLKAGPAMVRFSRGWLGRPEHVEQWLDKYWRGRFPAAPLIVAFWGWEHVATWVSPDYFPFYPSDEGFARCVRAARAARGHPFLWPSGYHWCLTYGKRGDGSFEYDSRAKFDRAARAHAVVRRDGKLLVRHCRWLRGGANAVLCRGDVWTRRWFDDIARRLAAGGADMIQIDQVVGAAAPGDDECYAPDHGHPLGPGLWGVQAFHEQLRSLRAACDRVRPGVVLGFEEPQELFLQQIGIQDYRDYERGWRGRLPGRERASVFAYLYHEYVPLFQSNPRAGDRRMMAYCLVNGEIPHLVPHWPVEPSPLPVNGSFDEWAGDAPAGWSRVKGYRGQTWTGRPHRDERVKRGGAASLRLENAAPGQVVQVSQNISIGPYSLRVGRTYRFHIWTKVDAADRRSGVWLGAFDDRWKRLAGWTVPLEPSPQWRERVVSMTLPRGATRLRIMLHGVGPCRFWLDEASLDERTPQGGWAPGRWGGLPSTHDLATRWVEMFHAAGRPFLLLGRMLHPPRVLEPKAGAGGDAVLVNAFRAPDGREAIVAVNASDADVRAALAWRGRVLRAALPAWTPKLILASGAADE